MKRLVSVIIGIGVMGGMTLALRGSEASKFPAAWRLMAGYSAQEALGVLEQQPDSPERQLALATALLGKYPQTPGNVNLAESLLQNMVQAKEHTDMQAAAWYLLGRIAHVFHEGREAEAEHYYRQLREFYPDNQLADSAAVKLALIAVGRIAADLPEAEVRRIFEDLAAPRHRLAQSDFHYVLAEFYLARGDLSAALVHLIEVRGLGANHGKNEADLLVQIGRVADELGRTETSVEAFESFLERFPSDTRNYMVGERLKTLREGGSP